uniref:Uncharacterized protein n=1 Tax=Linum usitatissimum TaxID=4006 RepID=A0A172MLD0_LINUS|nr:hypothetical protein [Linum usitatissimum]
MKLGCSNFCLFFLCALIFSLLMFASSPLTVCAARDPFSVSEWFNDGVGIDDYPPTGPNPCHDPRHPCKHPPPADVVLRHQKVIAPAPTPVSALFG